MASPTSCARCSLPLPADSGSRLCPSCLATGETVGLPAATPESLTPAAVVTATNVPANATASAGDETGSVPPGGFWLGGLPAAPPGYELLGRLGRGGMGEVFLAKEQATERRVAMKFLRSHGNPAAVTRFLNEVKALARLDHAHIVGIYATDFQRADPFFTMEHAPGGSLADRVAERGPFAPREAAGLMARVARALHAAHEAGVLHRDLKPGNVLLAADGTPKVSDFGLAKLAGQETMTDTSGALGTPAFMPPEQVSRRYGEVGEPADVYGLGATLYYLVAGRPPFVADSKEETISRLVNDPPPLLRTACPDVPAGLEAVVMKCLEKRPADRYATAAELADELERCANDEPPDTRPLTRWRRLWRWARRNRVGLATGAAAVLVLLGAAAAGVLLAPVPKQPETPDPTTEMRKELAAGRSVKLVERTGLPAWYEWGLMPSTLVTAPATDHAAAFQADRITLLGLCPGPRIAKYRVSAWVRHMHGQPAGKQGLMTASYVGVYIGHTVQRLPEGEQADVVLGARFTDFAQRGDDGSAFSVVAQPTNIVVVQAKDRLPQPHTSNGSGLEFKSRPQWPGRWRQVVVDVTPEQVVFRWREEEERPLVPLAELSVADVQERRAALNLPLRRLAPKAANAPPIPQWQPDLPFGIVAYQGTVAFREVVVEPIP